MRFNSKELKMALSVESFRNQFLNLPINFSFIERKETAALSILENPGPLSISSAKIANPRSANSSRYSYFNPIIVRAILFFFPAISASRAFQLFAGVGREGGRAFNAIEISQNEKTNTRLFKPNAVPGGCIDLEVFENFTLKSQILISCKIMRYATHVRNLPRKLFPTPIYNNII